MWKISSQIRKISSQIWKITEMSGSSSEAQQVSDFLKAVFRDRLHEGRARATSTIAMELGMKPSRVAKIIRNEITRVWADEYRAICNLHDNWLDRKAKQMTLDLAQLEARRRARKGIE